MAKNKLEEKVKLNKARDLVQKRFRTSQKYVQNYFVNFQEYYRLYRSVLESGRFPWRSNLFIPKTFEIVETVAPRVAQAQRTFKTLPVEGMDVENAEAFTDLLKFQFSKTNMEDVIEELVKESLIYGTAVAKITWRDGLPNPEAVDIYDFFPDPKARNVGEMKYAIHRVERDIEDLEQNPNYDKGVIKKLKGNDGSVKSNEDRMEREALIGVSSEDRTRKRFEVLEYWGEFDGEQYIIVVVGDEVLRCDKNPYANWNPFVVVRDTIVPHEFYGIGEVEPIISLQNELNDTRNQRLDNVKLNSNVQWVVTAGGVVFEDELVSQPGGVIHTTRPDGVKPLERRPVPSEAFTEESIIKSDMERTTGANSSMSGALVSPMGGTQGGVLNRTATAYQGAINQGDKRFSAKINHMKRALISMGRKFLELSQQFMTQPQMIRIIGQGGEAALVPLMPEDIKSNFDLDVDIEYLDDFQRFQQDIGVVQAMANVPTFDVASYMVDSLERNGHKDIKKYLLKPQPPAPEQPNMNYQLKGELMPDAVAQLLDKRENIKTHPEEVAAKMRENVGAEKQQQADITSTLRESYATEGSGSRRI